MNRIRGQLFRDIKSIAFILPGLPRSFRLSPPKSLRKKHTAGKYWWKFSVTMMTEILTNHKETFYINYTTSWIFRSVNKSHLTENSGHWLNVLGIEGFSAKVKWVNLSMFFSVFSVINRNLSPCYKNLSVWKSKKFKPKFLEIKLWVDSNMGNWNCFPEVQNWNHDTNCTVFQRACLFYFIPIPNFILLRVENAGCSKRRKF